MSRGIAGRTESTRHGGMGPNALRNNKISGMKHYGVFLKPRKKQKMLNGDDQSSIQAFTNTANMGGGVVCTQNYNESKFPRQ